LTLVNETALKKLNDAGLDEIRFHPNMINPDKNSWKKIESAKKLSWDVGVEIPLIPGKEFETKELIDFLSIIEMIFLI
jgi:pyruvate formate-lyase activating enzyme-like uncharacterized protein